MSSSRLRDKRKSLTYKEEEEEYKPAEAVLVFCFFVVAV